MVLPRYLAQTATEMAGNPKPERLAYLACHFSPGGKGLSNLPPKLPPGAMLILDDSTPMDGHEPDLIVKQLSDLIQANLCEALLLDFQRPDVPGQRELAQLLGSALPCPVGVSDNYAREHTCPVFLSPVPPDMPISEYLRPWQGREIWLEAALDGIMLTLTETGCAAEPLWDFPEDGRCDKRLHCHYAIETVGDSAVFRLWRSSSDLNMLLDEAGSLGVTKSIGLWQELRQSFPL